MPKNMPKRRPVQTEEKKDRRIPTTRYEPEYKKGLTSQQVQEHRLHGWVNRSVEPPSKTTKEIIHENIFTYFNLIFAILAVLLILVGSFRDLTFLPVIIANTLIGIVQEIRAKQVLDKLTMLNAPHATVVRDGKKSVIDAEDPSNPLDGPVYFKIDSFSTSSDGSCSLTLSVKSKTSYGLSKYTYSARIFPGLFG